MFNIVYQQQKVDHLRKLHCNGKFDPVQHFDPGAWTLYAKRWRMRPLLAMFDRVNPPLVSFVGIYASFEIDTEAFNDVGLVKNALDAGAKI